MAKAEAICEMATERMNVAELEPSAAVRPGRTLEQMGAFSEAAARYSEEALAKLRALPAPDADRAGFEEFYSLLEQQTDVLRQVAAMAYAGDGGRTLMLWRERIRLRNQANALGYGPPGSPVALPGVLFASNPPQESPDLLVARAEYIAQAAAICKAANDRFHAAVAELMVPAGSDTQTVSPTLEDIAAASAAAARFSEELLAELRALPPPEGDRVRLNQIYSLAEREIDLERQTAAAASAGDSERAQMLSWERVRVTHGRDGLAASYGLRGCPLALGA